MMTARYGDARKLADEWTRTTDEQAFKSILMDCEEPVLVEDKWNSFGHEFLAALRNV